MLVSIIIVSFNTKEFTRKCLVSIKKFVDLEKHEVIVADNASNDGSVEMIRKDFEFVKLISNKENVGFAIANNQGIKKAKGDYVLLLNSDIEFIQKNSIEGLVRVTESFQKVGVVVPKLLNSDKSVQKSVFYLPTLWGAVKKYWLGMSGFGAYIPKSKIKNQNFKLRSLRYIDRNDKKAIPVEAAVMAAMLIPRSTIEKIGLLDEGFHMYYEDLDYCRRIKRVGLNVGYVFGVEIIHHRGMSGKELVESKDQWRRLIPSSKRYHGWLGHYLINFVLWSGQKIYKR